MTLPKKLLEKRDELAKEWTRGWNPLADETNSVIALNYKKGFKDCATFLLPEIEKLREALLKINTAAKILANDYDEDDEYSVGLDPVVVHESTNQALQSLREFLGEKSEGGDE